MMPGDSVVDQFRIMSLIWGPSLWDSAAWLFQILATVEIALCGIYWIAEQRGWEAIAGGLGLRFLWIAFMYAVLLNFDTFIPAVIQGFMQAGQTAAHIETLNPGEVFTMGLGIGLKMLWQFVTFGNLWNPAGLISGTFCALVVICSFGVIAIQMAVTLIKAYILTGAGVLLLGFAPFRGTSSITERYLSFVIGVGLQLFLVYLIVGAGAIFAPQWAQLINDSNSWDYKVPFTVAFAAVMFATVALSIPKLAGALATGHISMGFGDVMGAAYMSSRLTSLGQSTLGSMGMRSPNGATPVGTAARGSVGTGGGGSIPQGAVPKLNSTPATGSKSTP